MRLKVLLAASLCFLVLIMSVAVSWPAAGKRVARMDGDNKTVITSARAYFDYKRSIAVFTGDVNVVDPEVRIKSDKLTVIFDGSNDVSSVTAVGNV